MKKLLLYQKPHTPYPEPHTLKPYFHKQKIFRCEICEISNFLLIKSLNLLIFKSEIIFIY